MTMPAGLLALWAPRTPCTARAAAAACAAPSGCARATPARAAAACRAPITPSLPTLRYWRAWRNLGAALLLALAAVHAAQAARLALVVGNDGYRHIKPLANAVRDADLMAKTLGDAGFRVTLLRNLDRQDLFAAIDRFQGQVNNGDEVAFFFAGHGVQVGNDQVLLPVDIEAEDERKVLREGVPLLYVQEAVKAARLSMLVVDACRDNPFPKIGTRSIGESRGLRAPEPARGQVVILSAGRDQKALDSVPGVAGARNGLFTWEFAQVLRTPGLDVLTALRGVRDRVEDRAASVGHRQRPSLVDDLRGQFYLFGATAPAPAPSPAPPPAQVATVVPEPLPQAQPAVAPAPTPSRPRPGDLLRDCADCPELVVVGGGRFLMGSPADEPARDSDEGPQREVVVGAFALGRTEVTFAQWDACVAAGGCSHRPGDGGWGRGQMPVINVSWDDAQQYVKWLSGKTGQRYLLPSEAQWEYAARAGTTTPFSTGQTITTTQANFGGNYTYNGSAKGEYRQRTLPVGSFAANGWGLRDMHGNVWEWVQDCYDEKAYSGKAPSDGRAHEVAGCSLRVLRGGSWYSSPRSARAADRGWGAPGFRIDAAGFRLARMLP